MPKNPKGFPVAAAFVGLSILASLAAGCQPIDYPNPGPTFAPQPANSAVLEGTIYLADGVTPASGVTIESYHWNVTVNGQPQMITLTGSELGSSPYITGGTGAFVFNYTLTDTLDASPQNTASVTVTVKGQSYDLDGELPPDTEVQPGPSESGSANAWIQNNHFLLPTGVTP
jgi:hypothetical protein